MAFLSFLAQTESISYKPYLEQMRMLAYQQQVAELNAALQLQHSTAAFRVFNYQHSSFADEPTNLSHHYTASSMLSTTPITVHNSSRPSSPPITNRSHSPKRYNTTAVEHSYEGKIVKRKMEDEEEEPHRKHSKITQPIPLILYDRGIDTAVERHKRVRPPSIEGQEEPQFLKRVRVASPVIRSNQTEVERCSP